MRTQLNLWGFFALFLIYSNAYAQKTEVIAIQDHVWVARNNVVIALKIKDLLQEGDQIRTGKNARVWLKLPDESTIKLGEYSMFTLRDLKPASSPNDKVDGTFELLRGVFRLTTPSQATAHHAFQIKANAISAGVRGTDIWVASYSDKDVICLLEGQVDVQSGNTKATLTNPRDYFIVPKNEQPVIGVLDDEEKIQEWIKDTDLK